MGERFVVFFSTTARWILGGMARALFAVSRDAGVCRAAAGFRSSGGAGTGTEQLAFPRAGGVVGAIAMDLYQRETGWQSAACGSRRGMPDGKHRTPTEGNAEWIGGVGTDGIERSENEETIGSGSAGRIFGIIAICGYSTIGSWHK